MISAVEKAGKDGAGGVADGIQNQKKLYSMEGEIPGVGNASRKGERRWVGARIDDGQDRWRPVQDGIMVCLFSTGG